MYYTYTVYLVCCRRRLLMHNPINNAHRFTNNKYKSLFRDSAYVLLAIHLINADLYDGDYTY